MTKPLDPPIIRELRTTVHILQKENRDLRQQNEELRGAVIALMEAGMPRILRTPGGVMVLEKKL
jgi:hypothetical protein